MKALAYTVLLVAAIHAAPIALYCLARILMP